MLWYYSMGMFSTEVQSTDDIETLRRAREILQRHKLDTGDVDAAIDEIARQTEGRCFGSVCGGGLGGGEYHPKKKESEEYEALMSSRYDF